MADWGKLKKYLENVPENTINTSLSFDEIENIIQDTLPSSSAKRWFWVNTPARWYSRYWREAGWLIKERGVNLRSQQVDFVRVQIQPDDDMATVNNKEVRKQSRKSTANFKGNNTAYSEIEIPLTPDEVGYLATLSTEKKAVAIVKKYLLEKYVDRDVEIQEKVKGADILVVFKNTNVNDEIIEVKGTVSAKLAWNQLFVSGQPSHDNLLKGIPLYRVFNVNGKTPIMVIMTYGKDFTMEKEVRWKVKRAHIKDQT